MGVGFNDGCVSIFDLKEQNLQYDSQGYALPVYQSTNKTGKHTSKVWDIQWVAGDVSAFQKGD